MIATKAFTVSASADEKTKVSISFVQIDSNHDAWRGVSDYFYDG
ncbi:hypothetical protein [Pedobacter aquatilis]|nr:hypothetical protein [Pedobacter aquatilis]